MKPRSLCLAKKAGFGAATTGALFALQHGADAAVIYTNPTDIMVSANLGQQASAYINLNGGGDDFRLLAVNHPADAYPFAFINFIRAGGGNGSMLITTGANGGLRKLASGAVISANAPVGWWPSFTAMRSVNSTGTRGSWLPGQTGFAGVRFNLGAGNYNYGWVRMRVDDVNPADGYPDTLTVFDYAYETTVNTPVAAGAGAAVPEPNRALLMLAGLGAAALRRKRKAA